MTGQHTAASKSFQSVILNVSLGSVSRTVHSSQWPDLPEPLWTTRGSSLCRVLWIPRNVPREIRLPVSSQGVREQLVARRYRFALGLKRHMCGIVGIHLALRFGPELSQDGC